MFDAILQPLMPLFISVGVMRGAVWTVDATVRSTALRKLSILAVGAIWLAYWWHWMSTIAPAAFG